jgi:indolepyruvate decarboxylase
MPTIAQYLSERLAPKVDHIFGIPGDYVLKLFHHLAEGFDICNTTDEQCAGFAADAYARVKGLGVVCATYCVGSFKLLNPIAGAYAEKSPVLVISGAPGVKERQSGLLLHHAAGAYECQREVFRNVTCASAVLDDPIWATTEIDRVLDAIDYYKQPGYIEIPRDMVDTNVKYDVYTQGTPSTNGGDEENLAEALEKSLEWIERSERPVILAGVEVARFNFGDELFQFAERGNIPIATTMLGKSVINEHHPLAIGVYAGSMSPPDVRKVVEESDCVIMLGVLQTDINLAFAPFQCSQTNVIMANTSRVRIRRSTYESVPFHVFVPAMLKSDIGKKGAVKLPIKTPPTFHAKSGEPITVSRLFEKINATLDSSLAIIADVGDSLFGAADLTVHHRNHFLAPAFYTSMGNSIPGALGVQLALPDVRPIVIVGDGAFQMTGMELSTIVKRGLNPIVFVLNNGGYLTERCLGYDGDYNNLNSWEYHKVPEIINGGIGFLVNTEDALEVAITEALRNKTSPSIINVFLGRDDTTPALRRMADSLSKHL